MAQYAMSNPAFATGNDAMDQGLGSLASAFFPDPAKVASAGLAGAQTRNVLLETQQKQNQLDARGQLQSLIGAVNNGAVPGLHPGSLTDPDGGVKMSGPAGANGSPAPMMITQAQIVERAAAAGYDAQTSGVIAGSVAAQMVARGIWSRQQYIDFMSGTGNNGPLNAQTETIKQGMVTNEQRRQFDQTQMDVVDPKTGIKSQISRGAFNAAPPGTFLAASEADTTILAGPGGVPTQGRRATSDGKPITDLPTYAAGQATTEYTDNSDPNKPVVRIGPRNQVLSERPLAPGEGAIVQTAPSAGAPPVQARRVTADGKIVGDQTLTQQQMKPQPYVNPADPSSVQLGTVAGVISSGAAIPPQSLDAQQALGSRALSSLNFKLAGADATPAEQASAIASGMQTSAIATKPPANLDPKEGDQFEQLVDKETDRRYRPTGKAGEFGETAILSPSKRQAVVELANQLRTGVDRRFAGNAQASITEAFRRLQADKTLPGEYDRNKPGWSYVSQDARIRQRNILDSKTGANRVQKYLEIGSDTPSVADTVANGSKPTPTPPSPPPAPTPTSAAPAGAVGPAPPGAAEGFIGTGSDGSKVIVRGGWLFPVQ